MKIQEFVISFPLNIGLDTTKIFVYKIISGVVNES